MTRPDTVIALLLWVACAPARWARDLRYAVIARARGQTFRDADGRVLASDTFTYECSDCARTVHVVAGRSRRHWCRCPRRLRGRAVAAWCEGYDWGRMDAKDGSRPPMHPPVKRVPA